MFKSLLLITFFVCGMANSQVHIKIKNNSGKLVKCDSVIFKNAETKGSDILCPDHTGCCILLGSCSGAAKLIIYPNDQYHYSKRNVRSCLGPECTISYKQTVFNMQEASRKYLEKDQKKEALLYNKTLVFEFARNDNPEIALEYEKQSYLILGQLLLNDNSDTLVKIENNDIFVDPQLRAAIKRYQVSKNLSIQNGQFTEEVAKSFQDNKNIFLKDKVFTKKAAADSNIEFKSPALNQ